MSRFTFAARKPMMKITMVLGMFPSFMGMIAVYLLMTQFNLINHLWGLILIYAAGAPMGYLTQKGFFDTIPKAIDEAARIDGCGELKIYSQIIMPMCKPGLATLVVFTFNFMWNDYMGPMIYLNTDKLKTIQIGLAAFRTEYGAEYGLIMAGTVCSLLPMVLIYCVAQKYLIEGIAFSGLKG